MGRRGVEGHRVSRVHHTSLRAFLERFQHEPRLRQRVGALAGCCFLLCGIFVAVGLGSLVLAVVGALIAVGLVTILVWAVRQRELLRIVRGALPEGQTVRRRAAVLSRRAQTLTAVTWRRMRALRPPEKLWAPAAPEERHAPRLDPEESYGWPYAGSEPVRTPPSRPEPKLDGERRRALQLNASGAQLRRAGSPAPAVALHLEALAIFETLDDRHAQASTLNGLALALTASGDIDGAVERFEEALSILREGAADPEQGKVIANLGFTLLKQGVEDRGRELLSEALEKLPPESPAAQQVEAKLRRAS
jgi:hypothetical protein